MFLKIPLYFIGQQLEDTWTYKYLGYFIQKHLPHVETADIPAKREFGKIISIFHKLKDMGHCTYNFLFETSVKPIMPVTYGVQGIPHIMNATK